MTSKTAGALARATWALDAIDAGKPPRTLTEEPRRWFAAGDPQTTPMRFFSVLERYDLLGEDGMLRPEVGLVSMGDHFDFPGDVGEAERSGREILAWLAYHAPGQVVILGGNHDLSRVMELAFETDESFLLARKSADAIEAARAEAGHASKLRRDFDERFPKIPTPNIVRRDYSSFSEAQRTLVERLLVSGRMLLATTAAVEGIPALLTHAAITKRELSVLEVAGGSDATTVANSLNKFLKRAVDTVREAWLRGERAALDLSPVHVTGTAGREGGGLLYHRPARRDRGEDVDTTWEFDSERPRRFEPHALPRHLVQVAGHSHHSRCVTDLAGWVDESAANRSLSIRTLLRSDPEPRYRAGAHAIPGSLILIDPGFAKEPIDTIELLALGDSRPHPAERSSPE